MKPAEILHLIINFKSFHLYKGSNCIKLAKEIEQISKQNSFPIAICPPIHCLSTIINEVDLPTFSQVVDPLLKGNFTAKMPIETLVDSGATGILLSDDLSMSLKDSEFILRTARTLKLLTVFISTNVAISAAVSKLDPHGIAFSPPDYASDGTTVASSTLDPIENHIRRIKIENSRVFPICGAGIKTSADIKKAIELGSHGIMLDDQFLQSSDREKRISEFINLLSSN